MQQSELAGNELREEFPKRTPALNFNNYSGQWIGVNGSRTASIMRSYVVVNV